MVYFYEEEFRYEPISTHKADKYAAPITPDAIKTVRKSPFFSAGMFFIVVILVNSSTVMLPRMQLLLPKTIIMPFPQLTWNGEII